MPNAERTLTCSLCPRSRSRFDSLQQPVCLPVNTKSLTFLLLVAVLSVIDKLTHCNREEALLAAGYLTQNIKH